MGDMKVVNLSRFLLFEEAGDSEEVDSDGKMVWDYHQDHKVEAIGDDAESCSSDVACYGKSRDSQIEIPKQVYTETHFDDDDNDEDVDGDDGMRNNTHAIGPYHHHHKLRGAFEDEDEGEDEDGIVSEVTSTANSHNSRKCVQSSNKDNMSEMEKSRLFWETCLAS